MGVHGLWDLLAPVGRRVSVETLAGKRLAIDASIWMVQFMKAMRDERGEMVRNAHLLGFFRRICKLLFLRTKPVFVFDGGTPALKRRTVIARRRQRENAQAKIRKTAEKLLLNHVKAMRLKNLAEDIKDQRAKKNSKGKEVMIDQSYASEKNEVTKEGHSQEAIDEMLAASLLAEECGGLDGSGSATAAAIGTDNGNASASASATTFSLEDEDDENDEEMILPISDGNVDPAVLAALPPSMQLDLLVQMRERLMAENRQKYQKVKKAPQKFSELQIQAYLKTVAFRREIDEVQRAAAGKGVAGVQTSRIASETNREFIFSSSFSGDKHLLASGGAEKIAEKQQRTEKESSLDVLNAIASSSNSDPGVAQAANEPLEDFVDDVQTFLDERGRKRVSRRRAMGIRMTRDLQRNIDLMKELEQERTIANNVERCGVNVDGKEVKKSHFKGHSVDTVDESNSDTVLNDTEISLLDAEMHPSDLSQKSENCIQISFDDDGENRSLDDDEQFFASLVAGKPTRISSADDSASDCEWEEGTAGVESGISLNQSLLEVNSSLDNEKNKEVDVDKEEVIIFKKSGSLTRGTKLEANAEDASNNESDVEWEDGTSLVDHDYTMKSSHREDSRNNGGGVEWLEATTDIPKNAQESSANVPKAVSKGSVEEEAALQEAIRRSLEEFTDGDTSNAPHESEKSGYTCSHEPSSERGSVLDDNKLSQSFAAESDESNVMVRKGDGSNVMGTTGADAPISLDMQFKSAAAVITVARDAPGAKKIAQIGNLANKGFRVPTDSGPLTLGDDSTNDNEGAAFRNSSEVADVAIKQAVSVMEEHISRADVNRNMAEEDIVLVNTQEREGDVHISALKDEDNTRELGGTSLDDELLILSQEYKNLGEEQRKLERNADSVSTEMFVECQELLQMFGLPYIISPMEAEAQCAYMELANLVDGVVTDDSDVFLFGARSVYKNIFDDRKYVETYFMKDIENELGLSREKLIRMALLLGSDYTEGISGIGIVNAIEVVNAFPEDDGLHKFREWIESPDPTILGKIGVQPASNSKKKKSKAFTTGKSDPQSNTGGTSTSDSNLLEENEDNQATDASQKTKQIFMDKHRNISKNWHIPASFPSDAVISAYTAPQVDKSTEPFTWGKPDIFSLRRLCWEKLGWASQKADELLLPVLKEYNKHETQLRLEAFYTFNEKFAKIRSKRIKQAVKGITGKQSVELADRDDLQEVPGTPKKRKGSPGNSKINMGKSHAKRKDLEEALSVEGASTGMSTEAEQRNLNAAGSSRGRGRGRGKAVRRGRRKESLNSEDNEISSHSSTDEYEDEVRAKNVEVLDAVRRSKRARKAANYLEKDEESDEEATDAINTRNQKCSNNEATEQTDTHHQSVLRDVAVSVREKESTSEDPSRDVLAADYGVIGGGFCADDDEHEVENNPGGSIESGDAPTEADKEYLQMGGGFCMDENEDADVQERDGNTVAADNAIDATISSDEAEEAMHAKAPDIGQSSLSCPTSDSNLTSDGRHETRGGNQSNVTEDKKDDAATSVNAFSGIPFLKRKRKT